MSASLLIDRVHIHASAWLQAFQPVLEDSYAYIEDRLQEREQAREPVDPIARRCACDALSLLSGEQPDHFAACFSLQVAAQREPEIYTCTYRLFLEFLMQSTIGAARGSGFIPEPTESTEPQYCSGH